MTLICMMLLLLMSFWINFKSALLLDLLLVLKKLCLHNAP